MKPMDPAYLLFTELLERVLAGDTLSPEDEVTYASLLAEHPHMREEASMMMELGDLEAAPSAASRRLADAALAVLNREEDEVPAPAQRQVRRVPLVLQAMMAAAAGFVVWLQVSDLRLAWWNAPAEDAVASTAETKMSPIPARVEMVYASGDARVINEDDHESTAPSIKEGDIHGQLLTEGQTVQVGDGSACFVLDPGIDVCMGGHSRLRIDTVSGKQRRFVLEQGRVSLQLAHQPRGFSVTVEAAGVDSTAVGTSYSVALDESATVQTTVLEGRVKVRRGAQVHMVDAHHRLAISKRGAQETMLTRPQEAPEWAAIEAARLWQGRSPAVLHVEGNPKGAELLLDGHLVGKSPLTSLVPAGRHRISVREGTTEHLVQEMTLLAG